MTIARVETMPLTETMELTGCVEPTRVARMASPGEGPVIACLVREGDRVGAGTLLARLGRTEADDAFAASARAELEHDDLELHRLEKLVKEGAVPGEQLDQARVRVSETRAKLTRALEKISDYRLLAPWSGLVSRVNVAVGDYVAPRTVLVELFDPQSLVLRFSVPEQKAVQVAKGAPVAVILEAYRKRTFQAQVTRLYPEIDRQTHTRTVEARIEAEVALVPGMFTRCRLTLASVPQALAVPAEAVLRREKETVVFVLAGPEKLVRRRSVELGIEDGTWVQILSGLEEGEHIAVAGHRQLREGMKVATGGKVDLGNDGRRPAGARVQGKAE